MNCSEFKKHILDLTGGSADSSFARKLEDHMNTCHECREEYERIKVTSEDLKRDASSIILPEKYRKGIKEVILKAPNKKNRSRFNVLRNIMYAAVIMLCILMGVYYAGGLKVAITPSDSTVLVQDEADSLKQENMGLKTENELLKKDNEQLLSSLIELQQENGINNWMMINQELNEALIEGTILSIDSENKKIKLDIYKDDNTPDIDPNITVPDGIFITRPDKGAKDKFTLKPGSIGDLKVGDHITLHYMGNSKSARAILFTK